MENNNPLDYLQEALFSPEYDRQKRIKDAQTLSAQTANKAKIADIEAQREKVLADLERDEMAKNKIVQLGDVDDFVEDPSGTFAPAQPDVTNTDDDFEVDSEYVLSEPEAPAVEDGPTKQLTAKELSFEQELARKLGTQVLALSDIKELKQHFAKNGGKGNDISDLIGSLHSLVKYFDNNSLRDFKTSRQKASIITAILALQRTIALLLPRR